MPRSYGSRLRALDRRVLGPPPGRPGDFDYGKFAGLLAVVIVVSVTTSVVVSLTVSETVGTWLNLPLFTVGMTLAVRASGKKHRPQ